VATAATPESNAPETVRFKFIFMVLLFLLKE
jgi:hypothetical protein